MVAVMHENMKGIAVRAVAAGALFLLGACAAPETPPKQVAAVADVKIGDICQQTMSFDVSSFYFPKCIDYLRSHVQPQKVAVNMSSPAEHRACGEVGLADGSPEFKSCVQEMYQLDMGAQHL